MAVGKCCGEIRTCERNCANAAQFQHRSLVMNDQLILDAAPESPAESSQYSETKPEYYHAGPDDLIAFALKHNLGAIEFTIMRYVMRWRLKQPLLSLRKAREYLDRLIAQAEKDLGS